ncbi:30S ribosomal protein S3 [Rickettsiales bacterium]|nr:30S ribosomal protein S3 [Rickettsiales bacterium]
MGQKVNPVGFRLVVNHDWQSLWYADKNYADLLHSDLKIRSYINKELKHASIGKILIQRHPSKINISIYSAKIGVVIGKKGADIDRVKQKLIKILGIPIDINVVELRKPELNALLIAKNIAAQIEKRIAYKRAMKRAMTAAMRLGAKGIRIACSGRLAGAEIARSEWYREGQIPLHTLRANIDYNIAEAMTAYGVIGIKVWVYTDK